MFLETPEFCEAILAISHCSVVNSSVAHTRSANMQRPAHIDNYGSSIFPYYLGPAWRCLMRLGPDACSLRSLARHPHYVHVVKDRYIFKMRLPFLLTTVIQSLYLGRCRGLNANVVCESRGEALPKLAGITISRASLLGARVQ